MSEPARVRTELPRRVAAAHDASPYLFTPRAVVSATSLAEVGALMAGARAAGVPLTLRSGGTSLAGQAGGEGVLVDVRTHWRGAEVLDDGRRIRLQPGLTVRQANARLARHQRRLGPDPRGGGRARPPPARSGRARTAHPAPPPAGAYPPPTTPAA
ncbi:FAD-binding oxidoreductase [Streptomyces sp. NPDC059597]|uniref:FAD-binding oxidoreductase n=1 Tax=Streptomyces sp. NPDC059597 TaxID=3346879 RepID=UPI00367A0840